MARLVKKPGPELRRIERIGLVPSIPGEKYRPRLSLGKPVKFRKLPMPVVRLVLGKEFYQMFRWFNEAGFKADIAGLRRRYPEVHLKNLEEWLRSEGWHKRARRVVPPKG